MKVSVPRVPRAHVNLFSPVSEPVSIVVRQEKSKNTPLTLWIRFREGEYKVFYTLQGLHVTVNRNDIRIPVTLCNGPFLGFFSLYMRYIWRRGVQFQRQKFSGLRPMISLYCRKESQHCVVCVCVWCLCWLCCLCGSSCLNLVERERGNFGQLRSEMKIPDKLPLHHSPILFDWNTRDRKSVV